MIWEGALITSLRKAEYVHTNYLQLELSLIVSQYSNIFEYTYRYYIFLLKSQMPFYETLALYVIS
jgi:hypothetical protein